EERFQTLHEIVARARQNLAPGVWDYVVGGAETETTVRRNRQALDAIGLRPRVLRDVSRVDVTSTFLGQPVRLPVFAAPVGQLDHLCSGAAADVGLSCHRFGVAQFLSSVSPPALEDLAEAVPGGLRVFQLYANGDAAFVDDHVERAVAAGYGAFCLTVDTARYSRRERDILNRWGTRWDTAGADHGNSARASLSWADVDRVRQRCPLPLILKGIATAEDAILAVEHGVDVVYVSNHGGRQLDHGLGAVDALVPIVDAVAGLATVFVDGGFTRGTDVLKALALGAAAVGIGRLACMGLGAAGSDGLVRVLELLEDEMIRSAALLGITSLDQLDRSCLAPARPVGDPHVLSAFPLLEAGY
ncbi:MAG: alpha-hydroxy-acid oxidizing protein, partial [Acidimicrobiia bacterium]|nr:alpha-hydroxy-acid oxidizing protein [Acidimicrobiia bacterium]